MKEELLTLKKGHNQALEKIYTEYRNAFLQFAKKYDLDHDSLVDVYQEAFIALREHAINGKLDTIKSSIKTYLFSIGKYMIYDQLKKQKKTVSYENSVDFKETSDTQDIFEEPQLTPEQQLLRQHFKNLGKRCQEMLTLFYYRGLTIDEITESLGYENKNVVKSQKSRCLKSLKESIKTPA
ncbi:RNA polymerase sigma factor, sigma-70 family [Aquimarina amphilecti]|uniref:RNA polymerase sigma factor, sigma-70 family n=1 Tax=Aquimarina amphilecti TaxID=1038014 RepID=A0A1H7NPV6_AQUAM|nr:sigma-70 family RNA polymerase sigma factor [Aquimarina amphilecti]SEL25007.1 RNA polymerase sigma factor, sigma-70 family [Aquimarina amphilecti]